MTIWLWGVFERSERELARITEAVILRVPARGRSILNPLTWTRRLVDLLLSLVLFVPRYVVLFLVAGAGMMIAKAGRLIGV